jgi:adenine phosphoribosyltransferase
MKFQEIEKAVKNASSISINTSGKQYNFFKYSFGEHGTHIPYTLTIEIVEGLSDIINRTVDYFDYIVSPEPGGHTWGLLLGSVLKKDVIIIRNQTTDIDCSEKLVINGYSQKQLIFPSISPEKKVIIIDDVISSGATLRSIVENTSASINGIYCIYSKNSEYQKIINEYAIQIHVLTEGSRL